MTVIFKKINVKKDKKGLRNCSRLKETKERITKGRTVLHAGLDPGPEKIKYLLKFITGPAGKTEA